MRARRPARPKSAPISWLAYYIRGAKAALLGHIEAPTPEQAIAAAAAEYGVPPTRILVRQLG
jgi:hypothetical protein